MIFATTIGPAQTQDYTITNSPIAKRLSHFEGFGAKITPPRENTTNQFQTANGTPLKVNQRPLERFQMLMEEARAQQMQRTQELKKISHEIQYQEYQAFQIYSEKLATAKAWSDRINQLAAREENQIKQQTLVDIKQVITAHPQEISKLRPAANETIAYNWTETKDKKWNELIKRAEELKIKAEEEENLFEEKINKIIVVRYG